MPWWSRAQQISSGAPSSGAHSTRSSGPCSLPSESASPRSGGSTVAIEQRFGDGSALTIGGEEEVMLVDAETLEPVAAVRELLADAEGVELPGTLKTELHASV